MMLQVAHSKVTWSEPITIEVMSMVQKLKLTSVLSLLWLESVSCTEESLHLWVIVIIVDWLDHLRVMALVVCIVELVWEASMLFMRLSGAFRRACCWLTQLEVVSDVLSVDILFNSRVMRYFTRLVLDVLLILETLRGLFGHFLITNLLWISNGLVIGIERDDWATQRSWVLVSILGTYLYL